jgi:hypothetical protein
MCCPRCAGLMIPVGLIDWEGTYLPCPAYKCVSCGNVVDAVIAKHQQQPHAVVPDISLRFLG